MCACREGVGGLRGWGAGKEEITLRNVAVLYSPCLGVLLASDVGKS